jgi:UDP-2,3-diacylglucosamine pyrophosphatase LpxH
MKITHKSLVLIIISCLIIICFSCNNKDDRSDIVPVEMSASLPLLDFKHDQYYLLDNNARSIEIVFSNTLNIETVSDNVNFSDQSGSLKSRYDLVVDGKIIFIRFYEDFKLNGGWNYQLVLGKGLKSVEGYPLSDNEAIELRTSSVHLSYYSLHYKQDIDTVQRTLIACISDIHCGDNRASNNNYSWFGKNADALKSFLIDIENNSKIKQLVIMGDLFDEWMVPYNITPFDSLVNITSSKDYFMAIANSEVNKPIFEKLREISNGGVIDVIYTPGNHDMLITHEILNEIIPGITWKSEVAGLGKYEPVDKIVMEHGHRYDFFNCPQPLVNEGHILPPGYFVTRLYAGGLASRQQSHFKQNKAVNDDIEFVTAWSVAFGYTIANFNMDTDTIPMDSTNVRMSGIDGYLDNMSFNGARDMYAANIEERWHATQEINEVPNTLSVFLAILNGTYLYGAALFEYLTDYFAEDQPKIVAFGHSHEPDIKVFPFEHAYTGIYANSGSWINADQSPHKVRTFLIINPSEWSGSELDVVSLYQYNSDGGANAYSFDLLKEESVKSE